MSAAALRNATKAFKAGAKIAKSIKGSAASIKKAAKALRETVGGVLANIGKSPALKKSINTAVDGSKALADNVATIAKKGGAAMMSKMKKIFGNNPKFLAALGSAKGVAAKVGAGVAKYAKKCATSKRCVGAIAALAAVGFIAKEIKDKLDKLDEIEAQCMADCLPTEDPADPTKLVFKQASEEFPIVCDGTDETGTDGDTCTQYCIDQCTDVAKKCKEFAPFLPNIACDAAGAAAEGISGFPDNVLDGFSGLVKTILKFAIYAGLAIVGGLLLYAIVKKVILTKVGDAVSAKPAAPAPVAMTPNPMAMAMSPNPMISPMMTMTPNPMMNSFAPSALGVPSNAANPALAAALAQSLRANPAVMF